MTSFTQRRSGAANDIVIANKRPSQDDVYIIAEIGSNHNQCLDSALSMIRASAKAGADAVKFQSIKFDALYSPNLESEDFKQWFKAIELDEAWYPILAEACRAEGVDFLSAPTYEGAIDLLEACQVPAYKIASPQAQANLPLVKKVAKLNKPMLISMGYSTYADIERVISCCEGEGNRKLIPLHCVSQYPMVPEKANLRFIPTLASMTGYAVGFSDHSAGDELAVAAVALGACVVEKHVTFDRSQQGPDHKFSMLFDEFARMVEKVRNTQRALGSAHRMTLESEEQGYREFVALKLVCNQAISAGEKLSAEHFSTLRSNAPGVLAADLAWVERCVANRLINAGELLTFENLTMESPHD